MKTAIQSIKKRNVIIANILGLLEQNSVFLIIGHKNPDEDCIGSMVAIALILTKFSKHVAIASTADIQERFGYLTSICKYNAIALNPKNMDSQIDTLIICDTAKPDMIEASEEVQRLLADPGIRKIELDHHIGADASPCGEQDFSLNDEASSTSELVGLLAEKLNNQPALLQKHQIKNIFTRNVVLAILTGIIADTQMGKFLKTKKEEKVYQWFSNRFNQMLVQKTNRAANFANQEELFQELFNLSQTEEKCFHALMLSKQRLDRIGFIILDAQQMQPFFSAYDEETFTNVARHLADELAQESTGVSLVVYFDYPGSPFYQFRCRRSQDFKSYDLRSLLSELQIENGGGHPGAIGFRVYKEEAADIRSYCQNILSVIQKSAFNLKV